MSKCLSTECKDGLTFENKVIHPINHLKGLGKPYMSISIDQEQDREVSFGLFSLLLEALARSVIQNTFSLGSKIISSQIT